MPPTWDQDLLLDLVKRRASAMLPLVQSLGLDALTLAELDQLLETVSGDLLDRGFHVPDGEPTEIGFRLEAVIDEINSRRWKLEDKSGGS